MQPERAFDEKIPQIRGLSTQQKADSNLPATLKTGKGTDKAFCITTTEKRHGMGPS